MRLKKVTPDETVVQYEAVLSTPRRTLLQAGVWRVLSAELERFVDHFVDRVGKLSEHHTRARRQLGGEYTSDQ